MEEAIAYLLVGLGTGALGVMVGIGGGVILVPVLLYFFHMQPAAAAGTSLGLTAINGLAGTYAYYKLRLVDMRSGVLFGLAGVFGAVVAPFVVAAVAGGVFKVAFGLLVLGISVQMVLKQRGGKVTRPDGGLAAGDSSGGARHIVAKDGKEYRYSFNEKLGMALNFVVGFISSFTGTGGGFMRTPLMVSMLGFPVVVAVATSVFVLAVTSAIGFGVNAALGHVEWYPAFLWTAPGLLVGSQLGARVASRMSAKWLVRTLIVILVVIGVRLVWDGVLGS
ncbi:MAG: sulfite exporter TauE/SafE family protein [SAR202 cluster bacterium]|nr:sulfite exporter TauE/SafE family protein [SAR202 cluster bacterium]